ncbi:glycosyltransferase [Pontiella agarivorans]|uniref:Glycosyltransferase n=1 Tax=Pontiella agarivorans TaxID=3038953 RepID=A0ABU5MUR3_9BACT|nr:glycosyltransferase [Pontiella agarivorans]MDZ8117883.1 glycosyltransferase [Pontiella agarivorans]
MKILFITYGELTLGGESFRPVAILRALAEAGHRIHIIASHIDLPPHPNVRVIEGNSGSAVPVRRLRVAVLKATGSMKYDAVHAVDYATVWAMRACRFRRLPFIYDATRTFTGKSAHPPSKRWKWFRTHFSGIEKKLLARAAAVLVPCPTLEADLKALQHTAAVVRLEDVPAQSLFGCDETPERAAIFSQFTPVASGVVAVSVTALTNSELRMLLLAARKVMDAVPGISFVFRGAGKDAPKMAANLDIDGRCLFLDFSQTGKFLEGLNVASAALWIPSPNRPYCDPSIFTLLRSPAPLVVVQDKAYGGLLTEENSFPVVRTADAIAEGLLRVIREPLFSLRLVTEAQQLIADRYSFSTFKHNIRMIYHERLSKK